MGITKTNTPPYYNTEGGTGKVYRVILTQTGTDAPVAAVTFQNTIGEIVWTRHSEGRYDGTLLNAFPENKTVIPPFSGLTSIPIGFDNPLSHNYSVSPRQGPSLGNVVSLYTKNSTTGVQVEMSTITGSDGLLVEIIVYP